VKKTLEYIESFNGKSLSKVVSINATEEMKNLEQDTDKDKVADSVAESISKAEGIENSGNNND